MAFNSYEFVFCFLPATFFLYLLVRKTPLHNLILLIASYVFYTWGNYKLIFCILYASILDYVLAIKIANTEDNAKRKFFLTLSIVGNLAFLCFFKYAGWFISILNGAALQFNWDWQIALDPLPLPPGISFYTFQTISYTVDVYRKKMPPEKDFVTYLTYVSFFPQLVAGPIERGTHLIPQLKKIRERVSYENFNEAFFLIAWGLTKKIALADNLGHMVNLCLKSSHVPGAGVLAVYAFCFQIYCDFSAYTDIARGSAKLFGVELMRNFMTPYFAKSPSDFWTRWHISLSSWLKDYLYIPLGGNRHGPRNTLRNLMITMSLGGLWHGAGIFFVIWGIYHGFLLALYRLIPIDEILTAKFKRFGRALSIFLMFQLTCVGWLLFRSQPPEIFQHLCVNFIDLFIRPLDPTFWNLLYGVVLFSAPVVITETLGFRKQCEFVDLHRNFSLLSKLLLYIAMFYAVIWFGKREAYDFIYFAF